MLASVAPQNRFFRLPFQFDPDRLLTDLATAQTVAWPQHYNTNDYEGHWSSIALRSLSGSEADVRALPGTFQDTPLLARCPYIGDILAQLHYPLEAVRLLSLAPGSIIREHRDQQTSYEYNYLRLHIPIQTGEQVAFVVDGETLPMAVGDCWYANFDLLHSVHNAGTTERVHLVIDGHRNAWTDALFAKAGYDFAATPKEEQSPEVKAQMIALLEAMNTDTARRLIDKLLSE